MTDIVERLRTGKDRVIAHCVHGGASLMSIPVNFDCDIDVLLVDAEKEIEHLRIRSEKAEQRADALEKRARELEEELAGFQRTLSEALNSGDGTYKP